ncbi:hypothetical protein [Thermoflexus sp.]|uniref:hypothetical protein n=1 Tax=Thermoflexus sp. TaxID=1969742 RepID=UPI0035E44283
MDDKDRVCGQVFNWFTYTIWKGTYHPCSTIEKIVRGFVQSIPTRQLAEELELDYGILSKWWHRLQRLGLEHRPIDLLLDEEMGADERFQNVGEKG